MRSTRADERTLALIRKDHLAVIESLEQLAKLLRDVAERAAKMLTMAGHYTAISALPKIELPEVHRGIATCRGRAEGPPQRSVSSTESRSIRIESNGDVPRRQIDILRALAEWEVLGDREPTREQVAAFAEVSSRLSGYEKNVSTLKTAGLVDYRPGRLVMTDSGKQKAPQPGDLSTSEKILDRCLSVVSGPQGRILKALHGRCDEFVPRDELAEASGQSATSSGFEKNVSVLKSAGMVVYGSGSVKAADWLFV